MHEAQCQLNEPALYDFLPDFVHSLDIHQNTEYETTYVSIAFYISDSFL